jgi:hypothetical protein
MEASFRKSGKFQSDAPDIGALEIHAPQIRSYRWMALTPFVPVIGCTILKRLEESAKMRSISAKVSLLTLKGCESLIHFELRVHFYS